LAILFLPLAVFIFIIGWSLQWLEQAQNKNRVKTAQEESVVTEGGATDECLEVKVIEDLMERLLKTGYCATVVVVRSCCVCWSTTFGVGRGEVAEILRNRWLFLLVWFQRLFSCSGVSLCSYS